MNRSYEWFKKSINNCNKYQELSAFNKECPKLYQEYMNRYQRESKPKNDIQDILDRM